MTNPSSRFSPYATRFLAASAVALLILQLAMHWVSICGSTAHSLAMGTLGLATAMVLASSLPRQASAVSLATSGLSAIGLSAIAPDCMDVMLTASSSWATTSIAFGFVLPAAFVAIPAFCILFWARTAVERAEAVAGFQASLAGVAGFAMSSLMFVGSWLQFPACVLPITACIAGTVVSLRRGNAVAIDDNQPVSAGQVAEAVLALACGLLVHAIFRLFGTLYLSNLLIVATSIPVFLTGIIAVQWLPRKTLMIPAVSVLALLCPIVLYGSFAEFNLWVNATIDQAWLSIVLRSVQPATACVFLWTVYRCARFRLKQNVESDKLARTHLFAPETLKPWTFVCCGIAMGMLSVAFSTAVRTEWVVGMGLVCMVAFSTPARTRGVGRDWAMPATITGTTCALLAACSLPIADSSYLLFNNRSAMAYRDGMDIEVIQESDSHRLLDSYTTASGEVTVWRTDGDQIEFRIDGLPIGKISENQALSPIPQADALTTILPLVMHKKPGEVMLLGDDVGVGVKICQNFPIPKVRAYQSIPESAELSGRYTWNQDLSELNEDPRFDIRQLPSVLAVRQPAPVGGYDVVVSSIANPFLTDRLPEFHEEHYQRIRRMMSPDGVYCQRVSQHDLGADTLIQLVSTIRQTFPSAIIIQTVPGELVILAACEKGSLLDVALLERLQKKHVKRQLALSGLDWSQVAALPVVQTEGLFGMFDHLPQKAAANSRIAHLAFSLPFEASRWANKSDELRKTFAPHQLRIADATPASPAHAEYARRFAAVVQEGEIVSAFPDNPWPYRKSLRMEMKRNPRPPVESFVGGEMVESAHPDDQRRKDYFVQLGKLLTQAKMGFTNPMDVRKFQSIIAEHEPLLTWFAHHELVRIFEATGRMSPAQEFRSRLYTVRFASVADAGVYQLASVLEQLIEQPGLVPDTGRRYDYANGLLQELIRRWDRRRDHDPVSAAQAQMDVDRCIKVSRKTLDAMEEWSKKLDVDENRFIARRRFINQALVIPLREYSDTVLAHRRKSVAQDSPATSWEPDSDLTDPEGLPLLADPNSALTN